MKDLSFEQKQNLYNYLSSFITEERKAKLDLNITLRTKHITVVLEDIYQPHNASAVLRSCDCFGIQDIHIIENKNPYAINPDVALGSANWIDIYNYKSNSFNTPECFESLKKKGYSIVATTPHDNSCFIEDLDITEKTALVFGTEKNGLSDYALKNADKYVKIPMYGFTESFNISVTAALSLFYLGGKMRKAHVDWNLSEMEQIDIKIKWIKQSLRDGELLEKMFLKS